MSNKLNRMQKEMQENKEKTVNVNKESRREHTHYTILAGLLMVTILAAMIAGASTVNHMNSKKTNVPEVGTISADYTTSTPTEIVVETPSEVHTH